MQYEMISDKELDRLLKEEKIEITGKMIAIRKK